VTSQAGYSGTPLSKKLGMSGGLRVAVLNAPPHYWELVADALAGLRVLEPGTEPLDLVHIFVTRRSELRERLPALLEEIEQNGMIWVSWPKKSSGVVTDVTEDVIREEALPLGLVDVKVCAVDMVWSGLKLVIRKELRRRAPTFKP
jgi:hypothetical protein